jgi:Co/Zn/Cd efflux system component
MAHNASAQPIIGYSKRFFQDKHGKIVIWQMPNVPLWIWVGCSVLGWAMKRGIVHTAAGIIGTIALIVWALLEIFSGVNIFRRVLGIVVMGLILSRFIKL